MWVTFCVRNKKNWSSANNSVLKINFLKYLLLFSFCNQILITSSKYKLNKTSDSGHSCLTPWVIPLESSDIPLPYLIMFSIYIFRIIVIRWVGIPLLNITVHNLSVQGVKGFFKINEINICGDVKFSMFFNYLWSWEYAVHTGSAFPKSVLLF